MTAKTKTLKAFEPGRGYSKEDWDTVSDSPSLTKEELASARPFKEVFPEIALKMEKAIAIRGRPKLEQTKTALNIRLDADIVQHYKKTGRGWQSRMNEALRKAAGL